MREHSASMPPCDHDECPPGRCIRRPLIIVCGLVRHGKSELAAAIARHIPGGRFADTSSIIYQEYAARLGVSEAELRSMPKEEIRPGLIATGDDLCDPDPGALVKALRASGASVVAGVRRLSELDSVEGDDPDGVLPVWVVRPGVPTIVDNTDPSLRDRCRVIVHNDGTLDDLAVVGAIIARSGGGAIPPSCVLHIGGAGTAG